MGAMQAMEMAGALEREPALRWHLQHNHYPPVPLSMLPVCEAALDADDSDDLVELPEGVTYRGETSAPAWAIIEAHHLEAWL